MDYLKSYKSSNKILIIKNTFDNLKTSSKYEKNCELDAFYCKDSELCKKAKNGIPSYVQEVRTRNIKCKYSNEIIINDIWKKIKVCHFHIEQNNYYVKLQLSNKKTILNIGNLNKDFLETGIAELKNDNNKSITEPIERKIGFKQKIHNELNLTWRNKFVTQFVQGKQITINFPSKTNSPSFT